MKVLDSFQVQHRCVNCGLHGDSFFCRLPEASVQRFESLKMTNAYPKGTTIYIEGQPSNGIYMLCQGKVKLSTNSQDGKAMILRIAEAGEVLGISAAVSDSAHEVTAEAIESCQINFIRKNDFLAFLKDDPEAGLAALRQLSSNYRNAYVQICSLGMSSSVADKLAKLFLQWSRASAHSNGGCHLKLVYTHEEIAEMIGTTRETISRLLKEFRERELIVTKGIDLFIPDLRRLEAAIGTRYRSQKDM